MIRIDLVVDEEPAVAASQQKDTPSRRYYPDPTMTPREFAAAQVHLTLSMAVEVERSVVSIVWHFPKYLGLVQRELHPKIHFTLPAHRLVLDAIGMVGEKCGAADWASALECVCESPDAFAQCGGREGLHDIYTDEGRCPEGPRERAAEALLRDHIRFLKEAAIVRGTDPTKPVEHYHVGLGHLTKSKLATKPEHPRATGSSRCPHCGKVADVAAWREGEALNLKSTRPERRRK